MAKLEKRGRGGDNVVVRELEEFSKRHLESGTKLYEVQASEEIVGLAYVTDSDCTFVWEGALDFSRLEEEVLGDIPARISGVNTSAPAVQLSYMSHSIGASLILSSGELQELDPDDPMHRLSYKGAISDPSQIQFVRFDVYGELHGVRSGYSWVCPVFTDCLPLSYSTSSQSNLFVLSGAEMPQGGVSPPQVVEALDVLKDRGPRYPTARP